MIETTLPKPSLVQDKTQLSPTKRMLDNMKFVGRLKSSKEEVYFYETDLTYLYFVKDAKQDNKFVANLQMYKKLNSVVFKDKDLCKIPQVCWIYCRSTNKNKDLVPNLYRFVAKIHGGLWSDTKHTKGAIKLWKVLCESDKVSMLDFNKLLLIEDAYKNKKQWYSNKENILLLRL